MSSELRMSWLGYIFKKVPNIKILNVIDTDGNTDYNWDLGADLIKEAIGEKIDVVFSSEHSYDVHFKKNYPFAEHVVLDAERVNVPISATMIRKNVYKYWKFLPTVVRSFFAIKVALVGTESCGKTTLCKKLSKLYSSPWVEEVGRTETELFNNQLTVPMFDLIATEQFLKDEKARMFANPFVFIDSEAVVTQYYLSEYMGEKSEFLDSIIKKQNIDLYLYLEPDVPWVADGYRFLSGDLVRKEKNKKLKKMFSSYGIELKSINGRYDERMYKACDILDNYLLPKKDV